MGRCNSHLLLSLVCEIITNEVITGIITNEVITWNFNVFYM